MLRVIKKAAKLLLPKRVYKKLAEFKNAYIPTPLKSYSQEGEDLILLRIFEKSELGFMLMLVLIIHFVFQIHTFFIVWVGEA
jgi:hypothetical protein